MGNCQAIDAATVVIQHPSGKEEKLYWSVTAADIMKANPDHYVALLITSALCPSGDRPTSRDSGNGGLVRVTRVKILRPTDALALGQVYRLITAHEVMKGLREKKQAKNKMAKENQRTESESVRKRAEQDKTDQVTKDRANRPTTTAVVRVRSWQPSLKSISEVGD